MRKPKNPIPTDVIILALSSKNDGYCVAGIDVQNGKWLRLTTANAGSDGAVEKECTFYSNGKKCKVLDKIRVLVRSKNPSPIQRENILLDDACRWLKIAKCKVSEILMIHPVENRRFLFGNTLEYVTEAEAIALKRSLELVSVKKMIITKIKKYERTKIKAEFIYKQKLYENISVTDPTYYGCGDGTHVGDAIIVASLPNEPVTKDGENRYYKLIAKIFPMYT
jgi:hypothetical protein